MNYLYDGLSIQNKRSNNMDSLLLRERVIDGTTVLLAIVCDGVGSLEDGAFASSSAVKMLNEWLNDLPGLDRVGLIMRDEVLRINDVILRQARMMRLKTASTMTAMLFTESSYCIVHIGDTRAYRLEIDGSLSLLTIDGVSDDGRLTGCIGAYENPVLLCSEGEKIGELFLVCSDGLYKRLNIAQELADTGVKNKKDVEKLTRRLVERAIKNGEEDNISVALIIPRLEGA